MKRNVLGDRQAGSIRLVDVHWFASANDSRVVTQLLQPAKKDGEPGVFESIRENGWKLDEPILVQPFDTIGYDINGLRYTADLAIAERLNMLELWKNNDETLSLYNTMKAIWLDENDEPIRPLYMGIDGNRRGLSLPAILAGMKDAELFTIPVVCRVFGDNSERLVEQISANTSRTMKGVQNLTWPDILKATVKVLDNGGNENSLRRAFGKVGTAQKAYAIVKLSIETATTAKDKGMPTFYNRCAVLDRPAKADRGYSAGGWVPAESLDKEELRKILKDGASYEKLESYVAKVYAGSGGRVTVTDKTVWENTTADVGSPFDMLRKLHVNGEAFGTFKDKYPELFSAHYYGGISEPEVQPAEVVKAPAKAPSKAPAKAPAKAK